MKEYEAVRDTWTEGRTDGQDEIMMDTEPIKKEITLITLTTLIMMNIFIIAKKSTASRKIIFLLLTV